MSETLPVVSPDTLSLAPPVTVKGARVVAGASSWADRGLVADGGFYPSKSLTARERLAYYCSRLPLAEVATTQRFPPTPDLSAQWAERTPDGFRLDLRLWSLLSASPTMPDSLWPDLQERVRPPLRERRRLYAHHLDEATLEECFDRFRHSLNPLRLAGRLGLVIAQYPSWFGPRPETWNELASLPHRLPGCQVAVELRHPRWFEDRSCDATLEFLESHGLAFVCVDGPPEGPRALPPVVASTAEVSVVRFIGRRYLADEPWTWPYRYGDDELGAWVNRIQDLASCSEEVHVIMDNCWRSDAVDNAGRLLELLAE